MIEQLGKLEVYLQELKQGYSIVQKGLTTIGDIKKGDFDLHSLFFNSLKDVNPSIKNWSKVADILAMQVQLVFGCQSSLQQAASSGNFSSTDLQYLDAVFGNLKTLTEKDIDELTSLLSDGDRQMTDDDRMARIDRLYKEVSDKYSFLRTFSSRVMTESNQRSQQRTNLQDLKKLIIP
ncbi:hypothetical protein GCM10011511_15440 [Puia dinghuensis]|uniref:TerB family tellurite resistance protein n=2 Tax=Puia dinghuensis TaxID=1792502 RepID=A0A8J2UB59_9BACT|nr:hypothetical protein GCM10011511_15440 [Puia dinghuensis]